MLPFAEFAPDQPVLASGVTGYVNNVIPITGQSYGAIKALVETGSALTARCQGAGSFRGTDGTIFNPSGDATKLYSWDGTTQNDVSRLVGGAYATPTEGRWTFSQNGNIVIALNGVDAPQTWTIGSSANFAALGGSPPVARYQANIKGITMFGHLSSNVQGVRWCDQDAPTTWTIGTGQADEQNLPDSGRVTGLVGGQYAVIFQERRITLGTYLGAQPWFQFDPISEERGCVLPGSIANFQQTIFFAANDGFWALSGGQSMTPIGDQKVDRYFWDNVNQSYLYRVTAAVDPRKKLYLVSYPDGNSSDGTPNKMLIYNWSVQRWSQASIAPDVLFYMFADLGYTMDTLDSLYANLDTAAVSSLDSELLIGSPIPKLAVFTSAKKLAFFDGANSEADLDTIEGEINPGGYAYVSEVIPVVDGGTLSARLITRNRPNDAVTTGSLVSQSASGRCFFRSSARYHRARVNIASGGTWTHAQGVRFVSDKAGNR